MMKKIILYFFLWAEIIFNKFNKDFYLTTRPKTKHDTKCTKIFQEYIWWHFSDVPHRMNSNFSFV